MVSALKKQQCLKGKPCGDVCIPKKYTCRDGRNQKKPPLRRQQKALKSSSADADDVKGMSKSLLAGAVVGGVGALGVSVAMAEVAGKKTWRENRDQYREKLDENAKRIPEMSKQVSAPKLSDDTESMIFSVGGFGTNDAFSESQKLSDLLVEEGIDKGVHHEPFAYNDFNVPTTVDEKSPPSQVAKAASEAAQLFRKTLFQEKENKAGIRLASQVAAFQRENPHVKNIGIISHSGGGYISAEAEHLLRKNGINVKVLSVGTPDWSIYEESPNIKTAYCDKDEIVNATSKKVLNGVKFDAADGHGIANYAKDPKFKEFVRDYFDFSKKRTDSKRGKPNCKKGKPCGPVCIPKQNECRDGKAPPKRQRTPQPAITKKKLKSGSSGKKIIDRALIAVAATAGTAAVSYGAYQGIRANYRAQYGKSAEEAVKRSKEIDWNTLPDYEGKEGGYLLMPGFSEGMGQSISIRAQNIMKEEVAGFTPGDTHPLHLIYNNKFNVGKGIRDVGEEEEDIDVDNLQLDEIMAVGKKHLKKEDLKKIAVNTAKTLTDPVIMKGRNEQAIDTAATLMAMREKYMAQNGGKEPDFKSVGVSAGGIYGADADEILKKAGIKIDMLFFGSPYLGIADPKPDNIVRVFSKKDALVGKLSGGDAAYFNNVTAHTGYQRDPEVKKLIDDFIKNGAKATREKYYPKQTKRNKARQNSIVRFDNKKPNCKKGKPCTGQSGTTVCIPKSYECREGKSSAKRGGGRVALGSGAAVAGQKSKFDLKRIEKLNETQKSREVYDINPKTGKPYSIRELKQIARDKELGGYSELNTEQLKRRLIEFDEADEEVKVTFRKKSARRGITKRQVQGYFSGKGPASKEGKKRAVEAHDFWKNMEALAKFAGAKPVSVGMAAVVAYSAGVTLKKYDELKSNYRSNFKSQSKEVFEKAAVLSKSRNKRVRPENEEGNNITFVAANTDKEAQEMIDTLVTVGKNGDATTEDEWLAELGFAKFTNKEAGFETTGNPVVDATNTVKQYGRNLKRGKDQDAIDLASQIYAYATEVDPVDKQTRLTTRMKEIEQERGAATNSITVLKERQKQRRRELAEKNAKTEEVESDKTLNELGLQERDLKRYKAELQDEHDKHSRSYRNIKDSPPVYEFRNKDKKINIIGDHNSHSIKTAMEILAKLEPPKGSGFPPGTKVLEQMNVVMLGTPHFGFTEKQASQQRTIISAKDPKSALPIFGDGGRQQWISSAKGGKGGDYLADENVREALRETFGFYEDSNLERLRRGGRVGTQRGRFDSPIASGKMQPFGDLKAKATDESEMLAKRIKKYLATTTTK